MKTIPSHAGHALGECLRAAQADADRFHGGRAPEAFRPGAGGSRGLVMAACFALLATGGATLLALGSAVDTAPPATVAAHRAEAADNWMTRAPVDVSPDDAAPATAARAPQAPTGKSMPMVIDGGDVDIAAGVPASVLQAHRAAGQHDGDAPRVAPMNVPTFPDEHDSRPGEPEPTPERPPVL